MTDAVLVSAALDVKTFFETHKEQLEKSDKKPHTLASRRLRNLARSWQAVEKCGDDEAKLDLMYETQLLPLGQLPASTNVYLEHYKEKMEILQFIAHVSFVQKAGEPAEPVDKRLISRFVWAAIWVTPLEIMEEWRETIKNGNPLDLNYTLLALQNALPQLVKYWRAKEAGQSKNRPARQESPKQTALERDGSQCVLLKSQDPQVAHIYPHASVVNADQCSAISRALKYLWGKDIISKFMDEMGQNIVDKPENLLSLDCSIHFWMDQFKVALEPIPEVSNPRELFVRFRHLQDSSLGRKKGQKDRFEEGMDLNHDPKHVLKELRVSTGELLKFEVRNVETGEAIRDGHVFKITTDSPTDRPLPSITIMQVYYRMALMIRLAGAAEEDDETDDDSDAGASDAAKVTQSETTEVETDVQSTSSATDVD
ncbi:hypothetical protein LZ30DRAFT_585867 [Colletotrichum cereale]|nr:hypothetical protein LZ30DRAFT_585867 [Colletotrichum cereale]